MRAARLNGQVKVLVNLRLLERFLGNDDVMRV